MKKNLAICLLFALVAFAGLGVTTSFAAATAESATIVNINQADVLQLQDLPGVGPALAERIIAFREIHGPFSSIEQLSEVKGVGQRKVEKFKDRVTLE